MPREPVTFNYDAPMIARLEPARLPLQGAGAKSFVTICGANFGHRELVGDLKVSLQVDIATHCDTLQHTAPHCNTLQHTATHRNTPQHTVTHCNILGITNWSGI